MRGGADLGRIRALATSIHRSDHVVVGGAVGEPGVGVGGGVDGTCVERCAALGARRGAAVQVVAGGARRGIPREADLIVAGSGSQASRRRRRRRTECVGLHIECQARLVDRRDAHLVAIDRYE